ncbi:MAG: hypothetical protein HY908_16675 [Myxococcales bacterium]|nr:hypothetical protein [Myxococcales bacterium]
MRSTTLLLVLPALLVAPYAAAQPAPGEPPPPGVLAGDPPPVPSPGGVRDPVAADALFAQAQEALTAGDWPAACHKFAASMELDPAASTLINLGKCSDHDGRLAEAWERYQRARVQNRETAGEQRRQELDDYLDTVLAALEPRLPRLRLRLAHRPAELHVIRDEREVAAVLFGEAVPIDPGVHRIAATARGHERYEREVDVPEGKTVDVDIDLRPSVAPAPEPLRVATEETGTRILAPLAWTATVEGVLFGGLAVGFALDASAASRRIADGCPDAGSGPVCSPNEFSADDVDALNARKNRGLGLAIGFGFAGAVALGFGGTVLATTLGPDAGADTAASLRLRVGPGGLRLEGALCAGADARAWRRRAPPRASPS